VEPSFAPAHSEGVDFGLPARGLGERRLAHMVILAVFSLYLAGLLAWLCIGLLPTISAHYAPFRDALLREASGHGVWARVSARIADETMLMGSGKMVLLQSIFSLLNLALGTILLIRKPFELEPQLLALGMLGTAATFNGPSHQVFHVLGEPPAIKALHFTFHVVSGSAYLWAVFLFPDGKFPIERPRSGPRRWVLSAAATTAVVVICWRSAFVNHPPFFVGFFGVLTPAIGIPALTVRMQRTVSGTVYQQCRLLRGAMVPAAAMGAVWVLGWVVSLGTGDAAMTARQLDAHLEDWFPAVFALIPVMLFIGILRYRLWDIDVVASRTLLYGSLLVIVGAAYVAVVSVAAALAGRGPWTVILALAAVALAVDPLRRRLDAVANRLVFGQSLTPRQATRVLAAGLEQLSSGEELVELTKVAVTATRAAGAQLWLNVDDHFLLVAKWPTSTGSPPPANLQQAPTGEWRYRLNADRSFPCVYQGRTLGTLAIVEHPGVALGGDGSGILRDLATHAGQLVHNAQLAAELAEQVQVLQLRTAELRRTLGLVVHAQDEERRRLERNLHDGAQHEILALLMALQTVAPGASSGRPSDLDHVAHQLDELRGQVQETGHTVETLCGGALPPELVAGGPAAALDLAAAGLRRVGLDVQVSEIGHARGEADIEAAVYFASLEAMQNAAKHSGARTVLVDFQWMPGQLEFSVGDDGRGFPAEAARSSPGLRHLAERVAVVGGTLTVESASGIGTTVRGRVPLVGPVGAAGSGPGGGNS
jgi:signal transduction histidine kinase